VVVRVEEERRRRRRWRDIFFFFVRGLNFVKAELNPKVEGGGAERSA
jgi:hypothetical protein